MWHGGCSLCGDCRRNREESVAARVAAARCGCVGLCLSQVRTPHSLDVIIPRWRRIIQQGWSRVPSATNAGLGFCLDQVNLSGDDVSETCKCRIWFGPLAAKLTLVAPCANLSYNHASGRKATSYRAWSSRGTSHQDTGILAAAHQLVSPDRAHRTTKQEENMVLTKGKKYL